MSDLHDPITYEFEELPLYRGRKGLLQGALINGAAIIKFDGEGDWWITGVAVDCYFIGPQLSEIVNRIGGYCGHPTHTKDPVPLDKDEDKSLWMLIQAALIETCSERITDKIVDAIDEADEDYFEEERRLHVATESAAINRGMGR